MGIIGSLQVSGHTHPFQVYGFKGNSADLYRLGHNMEILSPRMNAGYAAV